jgi:Cu-Zn family superoxide dismutase
MRTTLKQISVALSAAGIFSLVACQSMEQGAGQKASATLDSRSGSQAKGEVTFVWQGNDVLINGKFSGLKPNAEQGFHVHEKEIVLLLMQLAQAVTLIETKSRHAK